MQHKRIAVIDVETTGLCPWRHDRVVEIAIVVISPDGHIHAEYETLVNPMRDMGPTRIHQISATDVIGAPKFSDIAGDVLAILSQASVIAGHNVSFDNNFLIKEYQLLGVAIPEIPLLCTCRLFGRSNLAACCGVLGICIDGMPHRALSDARATARIVSYLCADDRNFLDRYSLGNVPWPTIPAMSTPCYRREQAQLAHATPPRFLQRISRHVRHDVEAETPEIVAYLTLLDRVLEDRTIDAIEEDTMVSAALNWKISIAQLDSAHKQYIRSLAIQALADGIVTDSERRDLYMVAKLLGQDETLVDVFLESASFQLTAAQPGIAQIPSESDIRGQRVCFTGELQSSIGGQLINRAMAEALASRAGLTVASGVSKALDILVLADPNTQSGKAKKAREYGTRILSEAVFWKLAGIKVD